MAYNVLFEAYEEFRATVVTVYGDTTDIPGVCAALEKLRIPHPRTPKPQRSESPFRSVVKASLEPIYERPQSPTQVLSEAVSPPSQRLSQKLTRKLTHQLAHKMTQELTKSPKPSSEEPEPISSLEFSSGESDPEHSPQLNSESPAEITLDLASSKGTVELKETTAKQEIVEEPKKEANQLEANKPITEPTIVEAKVETNEPQKELVVEPPKAEEPTSAKETVKELAVEPTKEPAKQEAKESVKESEPAKETAKELAVEQTKEPAKEETKEVKSDVPKEAGKEPESDIASPRQTADESDIASPRQRSDSNAEGRPRSDSKPSPMLKRFGSFFGKSN